MNEDTVHPLIKKKHLLAVMSELKSRLSERAGSFIGTRNTPEARVVLQQFTKAILNEFIFQRTWTDIGMTEAVNLLLKCGELKVVQNMNDPSVVTIDLAPRDRFFVCYFCESISKPYPFIDDASPVVPPNGWVEVPGEEEGVLVYRCPICQGHRS